MKCEINFHIQCHASAISMFKISFLTSQSEKSDLNLCSSYHIFKDEGESVSRVDDVV